MNHEGSEAGTDQDKADLQNKTGNKLDIGQGEQDHKTGHRKHWENTKVRHGWSRPGHSISKKERSFRCVLKCVLSLLIMTVLVLVQWIYMLRVVPFLHSVALNAAEIPPQKDHRSIETQNKQIILNKRHTKSRQSHKTHFTKRLNKAEHDVID